MADILNLAIPYFGLIFIGFACGKTEGLPEAGLAWMNFFVLYVSLPALLFGICIEPASVAVLIGTFASVITLTSVMWFIQSGRLVFLEHARGVHQAGLAALQENLRRCCALPCRSERHAVWGSGIVEFELV